jgi:hypothetical protein
MKNIVNTFVLLFSIGSASAGEVNGSSASLENVSLADVTKIEMTTPAPAAPVKVAAAEEKNDKMVQMTSCVGDDGKDSSYKLQLMYSPKQSAYSIDIEEIWGAGEELDMDTVPVHPVPTMAIGSIFSQKGEGKAGLVKGAVFSRQHGVNTLNMEISPSGNRNVKITLFCTKAR